MGDAIRCRGAECEADGDGREKDPVHHGAVRDEGVDAEYDHREHVPGRHDRRRRRALRERIRDLGLFPLNLESVS